MNEGEQPQMICYHCLQEIGDSSVCPHCQFSAAENKEKFPLALPPGITIGNDYTLGRVLGQGGFGITYIAKDNYTGTRVAIKEFFPESMATRTASHTVSAYTGERGEGFLYGKQCFLEEAKTLATFIGNPNIVRVYRYFEENETAYFVMEYVDGTSLKDYLKSRGGKISFEEAKRILVPVTDALAAVHSKGVVHRDISPDNIIITKSGIVKLLDFGAARYSIGDMSRSLDVVLKHGYAPREQYSRHGRQGPFTDVYSLAATFYRAITGIIPQDSIDRMDNDLMVTPRAYCPDLTPQGEFALFKALAVQPADRFQSTLLFKQCLLSRGPVPPALFKPAPVRMQQPTPRTVSQTGNPSGQPSVQQRVQPNVRSQAQPRAAQPVTADPGQKPVRQKKPFSPLKTTLLSFGVSLAVFGVILLIIILTR